MLNYEIAPGVLEPLVPRGLVLDTWDNKHFVSIVGFLFLNTRVLGLPIPFHRNFEEINLRFYVRRKAEDIWRRGVVFVREIVPRWAIATVARVFYNENYVACPMQSRIDEGIVEYGWQYRSRMNTIRAEFAGEPDFAKPGSEEEFITEHYWGYTAQRDGSTLEYQVEHPPWRIWRAARAHFDCDVPGFYGDQFGCLLKKPASAFVAEGSPVIVHRGKSCEF